MPLQNWFWVPQSPHPTARVVFATQGAQLPFGRHCAPPQFWHAAPPLPHIPPSSLATATQVVPSQHPWQRSCGQRPPHSSGAPWHLPAQLGVQQVYGPKAGPPSGPTNSPPSGAIAGVPQ